MKHNNSDKSEPQVQVSVVDSDLEEGLPPSPRHQKRRKLATLFRKRHCDPITFFRPPYPFFQWTEESPWPQLVRKALVLFSAAILLAVLAVIIYHSLLLDLVRRLSPVPTPTNGLTKIVTEWNGPGSTPSWQEDFSRDVEPKAIHSHNDYWRRVPLFDALSLGATGVEADCHLVNGELYVGHNNASLRPSRTFRSLYLDPLTTILENQNNKSGVASDSNINGVFDVDPIKSIVLMTDLKTEGFSTLEAVQQQLDSFRQKGWLTYWNGTAIVPGPIIHVGTGNTPFSAVLNSTFSNSTYRDVFFDAPLTSLSSIYNTSNSYYASTSLTQAMGGKSKIGFGGLNDDQRGVVMQQIGLARSLGLVSRYWDIPGWPVNERTKIWRQLEENGVGMLNADDIYQAARWNWRWCNVLGLQLC